MMSRRLEDVDELMNEIARKRNERINDRRGTSEQTLPVDLVLVFIRSVRRPTRSFLTLLYVYER